MPVVAPAVEAAGAPPPGAGAAAGRPPAPSGIWRRWRGDAVLSIALLGLGLLVAGRNLHAWMGSYDEGIVLYGADRVRRGAVPYRDFWTLYGPGQFYALAGVFAAAGVSVLAARVYDMVIRAALGLVVYWLVRQAGCKWLALAAWGVTVLRLAHAGYPGYPTFPALLFALASLLAVTHALHAAGPGRRSMVAAGALAGLAALFRLDAGVYAVGAAALAFGAARVQGRPGGPGAAEPGPRRAWGRAAAAFGAGLGGVVLPVAALLVAAVPASELLAQLVTFPATVYARFRALPYPVISPPVGAVLRGKVSCGRVLAAVPSWWPFYVPAAAALLGAAAAGIGAARRAGGRAPVVAAGLTGLLLLSWRQAAVRPDPIHMAPVVLLSVALVAVSTAALAVAASPPRRPGVRLGGAAVALLLLGPLAVEPARDVLRWAREPAAATPAHGLGRARGLAVADEKVRAIRALARAIPPRGCLHVGVTDHDRVQVNDVLFYFLAERDSCTRYHELHPGLVTTAPVQREMVRDLEARRPPYVLLWGVYDDRVEPNASGRSSDVEILDRYLAAAYEPFTQFGWYTLHRRRVEAPGGPR